MQPDVVYLKYFKLRILLEQRAKVWHIKPSGFKETGIRKFEFVSKTQFLYIKKYVPKNKLVYCRIFVK